MLAIIGWLMLSLPKHLRSGCVLRRVRTWVVLGCGFTACGFATSASAEGIEFRAVGGVGTYATAQAACDARANQASAGGEGDLTGAVSAPPWVEDVNWRTYQNCWLKNASGGGVGNATIQYRLIACAEGETRDPVTGVCVPPPCEAGEAAQLNLPVGYARTANNVDDWLEPVSHTTACSNECQVEVGAVVTGSCYVTAQVGPPYAGYCSFSTTTTGAACTVADEEADDTLPPIPCPSGTAPGSVNGVPGCFSVSTATTEKTVTQNPDGSTTTTETTISTTGETTITTTCSGDGACTSTTTHIGGGGSSEAPATSGQDYDDGKPSTGEGDEGEEEGACGKEGLPDCKVKVNEEGTPEGVPEGITGELGTAMDAIGGQYEYIATGGWLKTIADVGVIWTPPTPSGSCVNYQIFGKVIDTCTALGKVRVIWEWVIAFFAGLYIWRSVTAVYRG